MTTGIFERAGIKIENHGGIQLDHLRLIFEEMLDLKMYEHIDVYDRDVLDIGSYYGETAIYFSKKGARRVIALEPFDTFNFIDKNAKLNGCDNIIPLRAAYFVLPSVNVQGDYLNHGASRLTDGQFYANDQNKISIPGLTLKDLVTAYGLKDAVLKMDNEGAEREGIMHEDINTLRAFKQMVIEYHYVPMYEGESIQLFEKHLADAGFKVWHEFNRQMVTMVYADRID